MPSDSSLSSLCEWNLLNFQVGILKRVLEEVEKVMQEFKAMLYKTMEDPNIDLTNVRFIIYYSRCTVAVQDAFPGHFMRGISINWPSALMSYRRNVFFLPEQEKHIGIKIWRKGKCVEN